jgi:hypothetical protein
VVIIAEADMKPLLCMSCAPPSKSDSKGLSLLRIPASCFCPKSSNCTPHCSDDGDVVRGVGPQSF